MIPQEIIDDLDMLSLGIQDMAEMFLNDLSVTGASALNALAVKLRETVEAVSEICLTAKGGDKK